MQQINHKNSFEFLRLIVTCGVESAKAVGVINVKGAESVKRAFKTEQNVTPGTYAYIRSDEITDAQFGQLECSADDIIMSDEMDTNHPEENVPVMYMLYLLSSSDCGHTIY